MNEWRKIFKPDQIVNNIFEINFEDLKKKGILSLILDIDDTLLPRKANDVSPKVFEWVVERKEEGFKICLASNSRHPLRIKLIGETLGLPALSLGFKPLPFAFWNALKTINSKPEESAMVGDQLFMDILGANLLKIHSIYVKPLSEETFLLRKWMRRAEDWVLNQAS